MVHLDWFLKNGACLRKALTEASTKDEKGTTWTFYKTEMCQNLETLKVRHTITAARYVFKIQEL